MTGPRDVRNESSPWRGWRNAEIYDQFVRDQRIYSLLNEKLVEEAGLGRAERVLDLGCGTGATTRACLVRLPAESEIVGVDASLEMVEFARAATLDPRARFEVVRAGRVEDVLDPGFDRVVCNAAFWQFPDQRQVLAALAQIAVPSARMVFNVPAERVLGEPAPVHPFQVALARAIEEATGRPFNLSPVQLDPERVVAWAGETGWRLLDLGRHSWSIRQAELIELMHIPAMIDPLTPGLSDAERESLLDSACVSLDRREVLEVPWLFFILERPAGETD